MALIAFFLLSFIYSVLYDTKQLRRLSMYWLIGFVCMSIGLLFLAWIGLLLLWRDADIPTSWWITVSILISIGLLFGILSRLPHESKK